MRVAFGFYILFVLYFFFFGNLGVLFWMQFDMQE